MYTPISEEAIQYSLDLLRQPYPGRGVVIGRSLKPYHIILCTWTMGRSPGSQNRIYVQGNQHGDATRMDRRTVRTAPINPPKDDQNTDLTLYNAMRSRKGIHVASNGHQTDALVEQVHSAEDVERVLEEWDYEPDDPIYTPRISAVCGVEHGSTENLVHFARMSAIRRIGETRSMRTTYNVLDGINNYPGTGWCLVTYDPEATEPRSFTRSPFPVPLAKDPYLMLCWMYDWLNYEHLVSLAVKVVDLRDSEHFAGTWVWNRFNEPPRPNN